MKPKIAIIQFPGLNCEYETRRLTDKVGMEGEFFRWNDDPTRLANFDGFIIPGGFSYEDRGRAGLIASLDPLLKHLHIEADKGKPILGICNGAQILVETGLVPGIEKKELGMCLARNKRIKEGKVLGTGYYNAWIDMKLSVDPARTHFTSLLSADQILHVPVAHGEGRFVTEDPELMDKLIANNQMVFRYCSELGDFDEEFPINPNGAMYNLAAVCNPAGNVMSMMPHPERDLNAGELIFGSIKKAIIDNKSAESYKLTLPEPEVFPTEEFTKADGETEFLVSLIITDNEAITLENALHQIGFKDVKVNRYTHYLIESRSAFKNSRLKELILTNELLNTNKELVSIKADQGNKRYHHGTGEFEGLTVAPQVAANKASFLVRDREDMVGKSKGDVLKEDFGYDEIESVKRGVVWEVEFKDETHKEEELQNILKTHIFYNHHSQECYLYSN